MPGAQPFLIGTVTDGNMNDKNILQYISRVPQLTCIWMSGVSELGNLTNVRLFCLNFSKRER